ncbi:MAG TPA: OmpA family protein [Candidatus Kapabacteria bacterium]|nr:OmpA family protein [Candidatus Kapabacteria bacterium]
MFERKIIFAVLVLASASCTSLKRSNPVCPPPPPVVCKPGTFDKILLDTTLKGPGMVQMHIVSLPTGINTPANEHSLSFLNTSGRIYALITSDRDGDQKMYSAAFKTTTSYGNINTVVVSDSSHPLGAPFYCNADQLLYFSAKANNDDPDDYDLFTATVTMTNDVITLINIRPIVSLNAPGFFNSQPTLDPTGKFIYFVSDRPGGNGGTDIWYAERSSITGAWSGPEPLPPPVNSECDELSPYISAGDPTTLYFSSNGHSTVGGYDLFKAKGSGSQFQDPENLGKPINTEYDETFPVALGDTAFFWSSNRPGPETGRNIWTITRSFTLRYAGKQPILNAPNENLKPEDIEKEKDITTRAKHEQEKEKVIIGNPVVQKSDTVTLLINFPFDDFQHPDEYVLDTNGSPTSRLWRTVLDTIARNAKQHIGQLQELTVIGHTDSLGTDSYNDALGYRRAEFVSAELVKRGVPERIMKLRSKGSTIPVAHRQSESDEIFRLRTRRVECIEVYR